MTMHDRGFSPVVRNDQAHRHTKKERPAPQVLLGEPHLLMYPGDDIEHAIRRWQDTLDIWGYPPP